MSTILQWNIFAINVILAVYYFHYLQAPQVNSQLGSQAHLLTDEVAGAPGLSDCRCSLPAGVLRGVSAYLPDLCLAAMLTPFPFIHLLPSYAFICKRATLLYNALSLPFLMPVCNVNLKGSKAKYFVPTQKIHMINES